MAATTDVIVSADITLSPTLNRTTAGVIARGIDASNYIVAYVVKIAGATAGQVTLMKIQGGSGTVLGSSWVSGGLVEGGTYGLELRVSGRVIVASLDGVVVGTHYLSDADHAVFEGAQKAGIFVHYHAVNGDDGGSRIDNFSVVESPILAPVEIDHDGPIYAVTVDSTPIVSAASIVGATALREQDAILHDPTDPNLGTNPEREWKFYFTATMSSGTSSRVFVAFSEDGVTFGTPVECTLGAGRGAEDPSVLQHLASPGVVHRVGGKIVMYCEDLAVSSHIRAYESTDGITFTDLGSVLTSVVGSPTARFDGTNYIVGYELVNAGNTVEGFGIASGASPTVLTKSAQNPIWMADTDTHATNSIVVDSIELCDGQLVFVWHSGKSPHLGSTSGRGIAETSDLAGLAAGAVETVGTNLVGQLTTDWTIDHASGDLGTLIRANAAASTLHRARLYGEV